MVRRGGGQAARGGAHLGGLEHDRARGARLRVEKRELSEECAGATRDEERPVHLAHLLQQLGALLRGCRL